VAAAKKRRRTTDGPLPLSDNDVLRMASGDAPDVVRRLKAHSATQAAPAKQRRARKRVKDLPVRVSAAEMAAIRKAGRPSDKVRARVTRSARQEPPRTKEGREKDAPSQPRKQRGRRTKKGPQRRRAS
jgi:hypothetical protein